MWTGCPHIATLAAMYQKHLTMKDNYNKSISLKCATCGDSTSFEFNEEKTWVKCTKCNTEFTSGYDELVELNQSDINEQVNQIKNEVAKDLKNDINKMFKNAFKGNKNIKIK